MIAGIFHQGSGLGNQLHRYVATRVAALDRGYAFGMVNPDLFKGNSFLKLDMGLPLEISNGVFSSFNEKKTVNATGVDIRAYDSGILSLEDDTIIDGEFQDEKYFKHRIDEVREWLKVEPLDFQIPFVKPEQLCILSFRGGEYVGVHDLFLTKKYWEDAMDNMRKERPDMRFAIVTDDITTAQEFFPAMFIRHEMSEDWRMINSAHYLILSNSSFAILPALLNKNVKKIIAPKYWARHNVSDGYWALEQNKYEGWWYQDREGNLELCTKE